MELGEYVARYRKESGLTIDELAYRSGVPKGTINKIIAGTTKSPTLDNVRAIARALGKTLNDFYDAPATKKAPSISDEAKKVAKDYDGLDHHGKRVVRLVLDEELRRIDERQPLEIAARTGVSLKRSDDLDSIPLIGDDSEVP